MSNNYEGLRGLFVNEGLAYQYARNVGLIPSSIPCPHCEQPTDLYTDNFEVYKQRRICHHCQHTYSILTGTIFTRSKLLICQVLHLIYCWCQQYSCQQTAFECQVHANTVTNYFSCLRDCCYNEIMDSPIQMIGGPGQVVEIDESALTTRKYNRGRAPAQQIWVFGGICRQTHERFCFVVPLRNTAILSKYIYDYIRFGTKIISDCWKAYDFLDKLPQPQPYQHETVNHSKNFVDPVTGAHTQNIERMWREVKRIKRMYEGIPSKYAEEHICEYVWRRRSINCKNDSFEASIKLINNMKF